MDVVRCFLKKKSYRITYTIISLHLPSLANPKSVSFNIAEADVLVKSRFSGLRSPRSMVKKSSFLNNKITHDEPK